MHINVIQSTTGATPPQKQGLKTGDVVHGKVTTTADGKATVKMQDGSAFTATLAEGVSLQDGQHVKLVVTGRQDGKMTMQIAPEGEGAAKLAESTLTGLNLPTGGRNVEIATAFLKQGVSLSPELMQKAADIMAENPGLDADTAAFMAANNMDSNLAQAVQDLASRQNNISAQLATLEQILIDSGEAQPANATNNEGQAAQTEQASGQPADAAKTAPDAAKGAQQAESSQQGTSVQQGVNSTADGNTQANNTMTANNAADIATPNNTAAESANAQQGQQVAQSGGQTVQTPVQGEQNQALQSNQNGVEQSNQSVAVQQHGADTQPTIQPNNSAPQQAQQTAQQSVQNGAQTIQGKPEQAQSVQASGQPAINNQQPQTTQTAQAAAQPAPTAAYEAGPETVKALTIFIGRDNPAAVAALQAEGIESAAQAMADAAALPAEQGEEILQRFVGENKQLAQPDAQKLLAQMRNGAQAMREAVQPEQGGMGALLGKLGDMFAKLDKGAAKGIELKQAGTRMPEKLEDIQQAVTKAAAGGREAAMTATVQRAVGQSKAMEQINQFVYTQLPIDMNGKKDMAELYVFKRPGRQKKIDAEQVTMVIALDTQNMGHVESLIKVDGKNVFLRFRVDGDDIADGLRGGMAEAGETLASIGYNLLELRCELNEEDINILNAATTVQAEFLDVRNLDFFI